MGKTDRTNVFIRLLFVGIDVRGGKLIEVNVTSPAGLVELDQLYGEGATARIADDLERI